MHLFSRFFEGFNPSIVITDPEIAKQVLVKHFDKFHIRPVRHRNVLGCHGHETWQKNATAIMIKNTVNVFFSELVFRPNLIRFKTLVACTCKTGPLSLIVLPSSGGIWN